MSSSPTGINRDDNVAAYTLKLVDTRTGKVYLERCEWDDDWGESGPLLICPGRRVSGWISDREEAKRVAAAYTASHEGRCVTNQEQARDVLRVAA